MRFSQHFLISWDCKVTYERTLIQCILCYISSTILLMGNRACTKLLQNIMIWIVAHKITLVAFALQDKLFINESFKLGIFGLTFEGRLMQIEKALIKCHLCVSKVSWTFCSPTIYTFAVMYPETCYFLRKCASFYQFQLSF